MTLNINRPDKSLEYQATDCIEVIRANPEGLDCEAYLAILRAVRKEQRAREAKRQSRSILFSASPTDPLTYPRRSRRFLKKQTKVEADAVWHAFLCLYCDRAKRASLEPLFEQRRASVSAGRVLSGFPWNPYL